MSGPEMFWLNLTNAVLGAIVLFFLLGTVLAVLSEIAGRIRMRLAPHPRQRRDPR